MRDEEGDVRSVVGDAETYFAAAERATPGVLAEQLEAVRSSPIFDAMLANIGALVAIVNRQRQVLAINDAYLAFLGIEDPGEALGLRNGEALGCVRVERAPNGCGTGVACGSCGQAIALVTSLRTGSASEAECALEVREGVATRALCMRVRAFPLSIAGDQYMLVFLDDVTESKRSAALEAAFFHDINNIMQGLSGTVELLDQEAEALPDDVRECLEVSCKRLSDEIALQRSLSTGGTLPVVPEEVVASALLLEACSAIAGHPNAQGKRVDCGPAEPRTQLRTDPVLAQRVLTNMLLNAFEATAPGGIVRADWKHDGDGIAFSVWNASVIPPEIVPRIFQRYFSTKRGAARGQGTYVMRLLGEHYLKGKVTFDSSAAGGTTFTLHLPFQAF